ncbi:hypothetical protein GCM10011314_32750 [Knoellia flava]|uniref:Uncharacterized protein n=1 Tax=Knoellia flava TaxID=913969 RepID=A0A8H9KTR6_9MICO|nr:hypothetical protein GCM10011314_32750 [Knoellia flava]
MTAKVGTSADVTTGALMQPELKGRALRITQSGANSAATPALDTVAYWAADLSMGRGSHTTQAPHFLSVSRCAKGVTELCPLPTSHAGTLSTSAMFHVKHCAFSAISRRRAGRFGVSRDDGVGLAVPDQRP